MRHVSLVVQYDGTDYAGFQIQPDNPTIQGELERALEKLLGGETRVTAASRTDAGVHALGQVVTFTTDNAIPVERLPEALNALLPRAIICEVAGEASPDFHPRFAAVSKLYSYRILNRRQPSPFIGRYAWHVREPVQVEAMQEAGGYLVGEHDFAAFCAAGGSAQSTVREIHRLDCRREGDLIESYVEANGFLYMMVRVIMGTLVEVGVGRMAPGKVRDILASGERGQAGRTAPPQGLCLLRVDYN